MFGCEVLAQRSAASGHLAWLLFSRLARTLRCWTTSLLVERDLWSACVMCSFGADMRNTVIYVILCSSQEVNLVLKSLVLSQLTRLDATQYFAARLIG